MEERITIEIIESKEFGTENGGYSRKEVDRFLDQICDEMANLQDEIDNLTRQLSVAEARAKMTPPAPVQAAPVQTAVPDSEFREILEMAHRVKSETIANAEQKAAEIVANAQTEAQAQLGSLQQERDALAAQVDDLKLAGMELREKIAAVLKAQQEALDKSADLF